MKNRRWQIVIASALALVLIIAIADCFLYPLTAKVAGVVPTQKEDGIWLRYKWYFNEHTEDEWQRMLSRLREEHFRYAFFHVRGIIADGSLRFHYQEKARQLIARVRQGSPQTKVIAWVYIGTVPEYGGVDLSKPAVRDQIVRETKWLLDDCGFDGVQLDYEFCFNGDPGFLKLLDATKKVVPKDKLLSVATPMWYPLGGLWGWSSDYFKQVAGRCDQICVMCYDSYLYLPRAYVALVRENVIQVSQAVADCGAPCTVLLGIPTFEDGTPGHSNHVETLTLALKAVRDGYSSKRTRTAVLRGVCVFAEYTTLPDEWSIYDRLWSMCHR
jgi:hypothetical protein